MKVINKNKKGFTLVEVLVAMAIFGIMSLLVCTLYAYLNRAIYLTKSVEDSSQQQLSDYEQKMHNPTDKKNIAEITFGDGSNRAKVDVDLNVIRGNDGESSSSKAYMQYFNKK